MLALYTIISFNPQNVANSRSHLTWTPQLLAQLKTAPLNFFLTCLLQSHRPGLPSHPTGCSCAGPSSCVGPLKGQRGVSDKGHRSHLFSSCIISYVMSSVPKLYIPSLYISVPTPPETQFLISNFQLNISTYKLNRHFLWLKQNS